MTAHGTAQENGKPQIVMFLKDLWVVRREQTKKHKTPSKKQPNKNTLKAEVIK